MSALRAIVLALVAWLVVVPAVSFAQVIGPQLPETVIEGVPDYTAWDRVATRAERSLESGAVSTFALDRLRAELAGWRDQFLDAQSLNSSRIGTVRAQLDALGAAPADGATEPMPISSRRSELAGQLDRLRSPVILAQEAHTRANGLIGEIDAVMRMREAERLTTRGATPADPANWSLAITAIWQGLSAVVVESKARFATSFKNGTIWSDLFGAAGLMILVSIGLFWRSRAWVMALNRQVTERNLRGADVWKFIVSLGLIALPYIAVLLLAEALKTTQILGFRGTTILSALPNAAMYVIVGRWLSMQFFSVIEAEKGPLCMSAEDRLRGRRILKQLFWSLAIGAVMVAVVGVGDTTGLAGTVVLFPIEFVASVFLFQFGRLIVHHCKDGENPEVYRNRIISVMGQAVTVVAVLSPLLAIAGYSSGAQALLYPTVNTLAVLAVVLLLQRLVLDLYVMLTGAVDTAAEALMPVLIGFALLLLSVPLLALIWGAREADLLEVWTRFREGFTLGETRISPTDFLTFVVIFAAGYAMTRFVQGTLRSTVLPKTKLDIGGQNAVVSGLGYLGIFLAAVIAITTAGIDLSSLAIVAGALSVGIGFGLQTIVSNFVSGIILLIERPISEGDWIEVNGQMGIVRDISVRATRIETFDRQDVIVPNADLVSGQVTNWTRGSLAGRITVSVGVAYGTDTKRVEAILREIVEAHPMVIICQSTNVLFVGFGADSLDFEIRAVLRDVYFSVITKSEIHHTIAERFAAEGIEIPFAQRDIWLRNPEALHPRSDQESES